jgi:hypothetical protein
MKTSVFEKLIRRVVREEIDYALQREIRSLKEDLRNELKPVIKEQPQIINKVPQNLKNQLKEKIGGKVISKQNFVSNNTLNDLLNETARGDTNLETISPSVESMPDDIANVVNKDYRGLMAAIKKKKGR